MARGKIYRCKLKSVTMGQACPGISGRMFLILFVSGRENGTGLGLALASKIISDHDGWLSVDSVPGKTVFRISLPLVPREEKVKG